MIGTVFRADCNLFHPIGVILKLRTISLHINQLLSIKNWLYGKYTSKLRSYEIPVVK